MCLLIASFKVNLIFFNYLSFDFHLTVVLTDLYSTTGFNTSNLIFAFALNGDLLKR